MKLKEGRISILFSDAGLRIELRDDLSGTTFARVSLSQEQTCQALSRLANTHCEIEVFDLNRVGKKLEVIPLSFHIGQCSYQNRKKLAREKVYEFLPEGWVPDEYYGSQDSFFEGKDENGNPRTWARTWIRRWVDKEDQK